ncbi:hypothetical protein H2200_003469 [Cladophialophora chaetospira]|uniref:Uncharacterized protein n=1 Tax=Cladophialophora chaetospira TaxID=386627 RepID=A0AA38XHJ3_9EURO|nr:hypothetical protein H2200_003469 [Cladophialophora chaetospira]
MENAPRSNSVHAQRVQAVVASALRNQQAQQIGAFRQNIDDAVGSDRPSTNAGAREANQRDRIGSLSAYSPSSRPFHPPRVSNPSPDVTGPTTSTSSHVRVGATPQRCQSNAPSLLRNVLTTETSRQNPQQAPQPSEIPPRVDGPQPPFRRSSDEAHRWMRPARELWERFIMPSPPWHDDAERTRFSALQEEYWPAQLFLAGYIMPLRSAGQSTDRAILDWVQQRDGLRSSETRDLQWSTLEEFRAYVYTMRNRIRDSAMTGVPGPEFMLPYQYWPAIETLDEFREHLIRMEGRPPW